MAILRKVYKRRDGTRVITLPKTWIEILEKKHGQDIKEVRLDLFPEKIEITPKIEKERKVN